MNEASTEQIQMDIIDTIKKLENFWNIYRGGHGLAGYLKVLDQRYYVEFIFLKDFKEPFKFFGPVELQELFSSYFNEQRKRGSLFSIRDFMSGVMRIFNNYCNEHENVLKNEYELIKSNYRIEKINDKIYHIKVILPYKNIYTFTIFFQNYPSIPEIQFDELLSNEIGPFENFEILREWNRLQPPRIVEITNKIKQILLEKIHAHPGFGLVKADKLKIDLKEQTFGSVDFFVFKGETLGIYCLNNKLIWNFFKFLTSNDSFSGKIQFFERPANDRNRICSIIESHVNTEGIENYELEASLDKQAPEIDKKVKSRLIPRVLKACGLINQKKMKLKDLTKGQELRHDIALHALKGYEVLLFSNPELGLNTTEVKKFFDCLRRVNQEFNITILLHSHEESLRSCDRILVMDEKGRQVGFGTLAELFRTFPLGEFDPIIVVQVNKVRAGLIDDLTKVPGLLLMIEERKNEKYHLFFKENHDEKIQIIYDKIGDDIFNLEMSSPTLFDYLRYSQQRKHFESRNN